MAIVDFVEQSVIDWVISRKPSKLRIEDFEGDKRQLVWIGTLETTYNQLKDTATKLSNDNPLCTVNFDSQTFCQMLIPERSPHTYIMADAEKDKEESIPIVTFKEVNSFNNFQSKAIMWPRNSTVRALM